MNRRLCVAAAAALLSVVGLSGCGLGDKAANEAVDKVLEESSGGDVDIDSEDGSVTVEDEDGRTTVGTSKLPEEFPADVPLPSEEFEVISSTVQGDALGAMLSLSSSADVTALADRLSAELETAGYELGTKSEYAVEGTLQRIITGKNAERQVQIIVQQSEGEDTMVMYSLDPPA